MTRFAGISETRFGSSRPRLKRSESQWRDRDWKCLSLKDETKTETEKVWVSVTRPRLKRSESHSQVPDHKKLETKKVWVSMTRPRPGLNRSESQWRDRDRDWKCLSLNDETETEKVWISMTRPRLKGSESQSQHWDWDHKNIETKTKVVETIEDETRKFGSKFIS